MTTVEKIFSILNERNINQKTFATAIGVSQGNVTDWKKGRSNPSRDVLSRIASYLNISIDYLLGNESTSGTEGILLTPQEEELVRCYRLLNNDGKKKMNDYLDDLLGNEKNLSVPAKSGASAG